MGSKNVYIVYVDEYHSHPLAISLNAFEQINAIAAANRVCQVCASPCTKENPMVVRNTCLACFMQSELVRRENHLAFVGESGKDSAGDTQYAFIDGGGYVYLTDSGSETTRLERDIYQTLLHWGFRLPETVSRNGKDYELSDHTWYSIYGDFRTKPVIVVKYKEYYGEHTEAVFFVYKDKLAVEVNKRLKAVQQVFQQARARLEATRDGQGGYHYGDGYITYHLEESHLYPTVSELLSQQLHIPQEKEGQ
jgi:hypothetical protein